MFNNLVSARLFDTVRSRQQLGKYIILVLVSLFITGCSWFESDDNNEELPEAEITIAPTAEFSASTETGMAPLTVEFLDDSANGTATINQWQWDLGDGNISTEQNPTHTYTAAGTYTVSLTVTSAHGSDTMTRDNLIIVDEPLITMTVSVVDTNGILLDDVEISSDDFDIFERQSGDAGYQLSVNPSNDDGILTFRKDGYIRNILFMEGVNIDQDKIVVLKKKAEPIIFNGFIGGTMYGPDGTSVEIPGQALRRANGSSVNGDIELYITPVDVSNEREQGAFPGSYFGAMDNDDPQDSLFSYGVFDITFEENGEELQLADNTTALLNVPLYATKSFENEDLVAGDTIPFWYLNEESGLWLYESEGQVVDDPAAPNGLSLQATTTHFTSFNTDMNPPDLGRVPPSGGGSTRAYLCAMSIDLIGAEEGQDYLYSIAYTRPGWPVSRNSRAFTYTGDRLTQRILRGFAVTITVSQDELEGSSTFICNGPSVETIVTLGDALPEVTSFSPRIEPVFERDSDGLSEIVRNKIYLGAYWVGAKLGTFDSVILSSPIILSRGVYREIEYTANDPSPLDISVALTNANGTSLSPTQVSYIDEQGPTLGFSYAYYNVDTNMTSVRWANIEGADELDIYYVEEITDEPLFGVVPTITINSMEGNTQFMGNPGEGYLVLEFRNRYGTSREYIRIGGGECLPESESCLVPA